MKLTRRDLFRGALAASAVAGVGVAAEGAFAPASAAVPINTGGTSLARTYRKGAAGAGGYRPVIVAAGEPHVVRTEFVASPGTNRAAQRKGILAWAQLSDVHIVDAQSPMRVEWADRYDDTAAPGDPTTGLTSSAYRAHEMLGSHVADAMVRAINAVASGPVSGLPLAFAIQTGDNADNAQFNETRWNIDVLGGKKVLTPDSGDLSRWEGVADNDFLTYDQHYWHPDNPPLLRAADIAKTTYGFPTVPGLLDAARRPFVPAGLQMPWYSVFGNHDGGVQGNFPPGTLGAGMSAVATGNLKIIDVPPGMSQADVLGALRSNPLDLLNSLALTTAVRVVSADPNRRVLTRAEIVNEHFTTTGMPVGHGYTTTNRSAGTAYYTFVNGGVQFIVLDTVNPNGYADGSLDQAQFDWLTAQLAAPQAGMVVIASHHTSETMGNPLVATGGDISPRVQGPAVVTLLQQHREVVAWINGHTHENHVWARPGGARGFWEINTASHVDFPQQARLLEIVDNRDGTLSIFATVLDHAGPASYGGKTDTTVALASLSRELSANDWQSRTLTREGQTADRNVELVIQAP
ncbi:metallophosphoesterase [Nocardioides baekrokdamisoli]|uniref:Metallophosphoesterase n=1 Tax=Nocardioides baekrokdamisoli TaxID=1804624 RepID=A0A3G9IZZ8_9ACTN|nr:TIGR03767 family metallophosphoesterase [Nocardioides baekrokdamisoli]BBH16299.1 metallophosphoesterase [Nocardioides baekrokdamisoli]